MNRANLETALSEARLQGAIECICNQLRFFSQVMKEGSWVDTRIDSADPKPQPKPSIHGAPLPILFPKIMQS